MRPLTLATLFCGALVACGGDTGAADSPSGGEWGASDTLVGDAGLAPSQDVEMSPDVATADTTTTDSTTADSTPAPPLEPFGVVTFNTGSGGGYDGTAGYGAQQSAWSDEHYGNGLAWEPFVDATAAWFGTHQPMLVAFQEIFDVTQCVDVPLEARVGFVCEEYAPGDVSLPERILGPEYQVACHPNRNDKCVAVHREFGAFTGCDTARCDGAMVGFPIEGCGSGVRVARGRLALTTGVSLTVVSVHGSSGFEADDIDCRVAQARQVFDDLGDGAPAADGEWTIVLGDLNTDPARALEYDASAEAWAAAPQAGFRFHTDVGFDTTATYGGLFSIDHVLSNAFVGQCVSPADGGLPPVLEAAHFDHVPIACTLTSVRR